MRAFKFFGPIPGIVIIGFILGQIVACTQDQTNPTPKEHIETKDSVHEKENKQKSLPRKTKNGTYLSETIETEVELSFTDTFEYPFHTDLDTNARLALLENELDEFHIVFDPERDRNITAEHIRYPITSEEHTKLNIAFGKD